MAIYAFKALNIFYISTEALHQATGWELTLIQKPIEV